MNGSVTDTLDGVVTLVVRGPDGRQSLFPFVMDTGFNGSLTLPAEVVQLLALPVLDTIDVTLADGASVSLRRVIALVDWHDATREVIAMQTDGDALLGMSLLEASHVSFHAVEGGEVRIDLLP